MPVEEEVVVVIVAAVEESAATVMVAKASHASGQASRLTNIMHRGGLSICQHNMHTTIWRFEILHSRRRWERGREKRTRPKDKEIQIPKPGLGQG